MARADDKRCAQCAAWVRVVVPNKPPDAEDTGACCLNPPTVQIVVNNRGGIERIRSRPFTGAREFCSSWHKETT